VFMLELEPEHLVGLKDSALEFEAYLPISQVGNLAIMLSCVRVRRSQR
jgi:hypothetical protein